MMKFADCSRRGARRAAFCFLVLVQWAMRVVFLLSVEGKAYLGSRPSLILTGNHTGFLDRMILMAALGRPVTFLELRRGFARPFHKIRQAVHAGIQTLGRGGSVCIFPQGRPLPGSGISFHPQVVRICRESGSPIVPFAIHMAGRKVTVQFGQPIESRERGEAELLAEIHDVVQFMKDSLSRRHKPRRERRFQESVLSLMLLKSDVYGSRTATCLQENGRWNDLSFIELSRKARNLSDYLIHWGLKRGDRVSILSESRPEWGIAFFATVRAGGVLVPLDIKLTSPEMASILSDAIPRILFVSGAYAEKALALQTLHPSIEKVILLDPSSQGDLQNYETLRSPAAFRGRNREADEVALLIYTSGTTGNPKGVMITFGNLVYQVKNFNEILNLTRRDMYLSILPLNHLFELTGGFIGVLHAGGSVCYSPNLHPQEIARLMREKRITGMITVPLFLKMLKLSVEKEIRKRSPAEQKIFSALYAAARHVPFRRVRKMMFAGVHRQFGGRLRGFISGGAPLDLEVGEFFERIGAPVYQGYGLTETSPVVSVNTPRHSRFGSVGRPLKGVSVEILKK
jgi:1-acyl-sn-glycerol-3-phosphate acyltransferase